MRKVKLYTVLLVAITIASCSKPKMDRSVLVEEALNEKLGLFKRVHDQKCNEDFYEKINLEVDSMMYYLVQKMNGSTDVMPARPPRPGRLTDTIFLEEKPNIQK